MNLERLYKQLTGIDIDAEKRLWDERGKGYYGEFLVFSELYRKVPGYGKILMNLVLPKADSYGTEVDLVFLHETGIYVFEVKHYKGIVYGDVDRDNWTQRFRTAGNYSFYNPVKQNRGHIKALKALIKDDFPAYSFVVFTNPDVLFYIDGYYNDLTICTLDRLYEKFMDVALDRRGVYSIEQIDERFNMLLPYGPLVVNRVAYNGAEIPFYKYCDQLKSEVKSTLWSGSDAAPVPLVKTESSPPKSLEERILENGRYATFLKRKYFIPKASDYDAIALLARQKGLSVMEYQYDLVGCTIVPALEVCDDDIINILEKHSADKKVSFPDAGLLRWMMSVAEKNKLTLEEFIEFYGYQYGE